MFQEASPPRREDTKERSCAKNSRALRGSERYMVLNAVQNFVLPGVLAPCREYLRGCVFGGWLRAYHMTQRQRALFNDCPAK